MDLRRFLDDRQADWAELERLVAQAGRRPERLGADGVRRLGALYRATAADLAYGRRRFPGDPSVRRLETLVGTARHLVYDRRGRRFSLRALIASDYWRILRRRPLPLLLSVLALFGPAVIAGTWAYHDPGAAAGLAPAEYRSVIEPRPDAGTAFVADQSADMASSIFTNNIGVTVLAFASGLLFGVGTLLVLVYNGVLFGVITGLAIGAGNGDSFIQLVAPHGFLELTCICVAGAAGLRMGWAIVEGGPRPRGAALREEAVAGIQLVLGTAPWLVLAGLVEGFVTPRGVGLAASLAIGVLLATPYWALLAVGGRRRTPATPAPAP